MKSKILILLLFCSFLSFGQSVPNTNTFSLQDVVGVVGGTSLTQAFSNSVDAYFDPTYKGSKDRLSNFRNYTIPSCTPPTVTTTAITAITSSSANSGGNVTADGGCSVTVRGIEWSYYSNFSSILGSTSNGTGTGFYTSTMSGLPDNTTFYVRAYATNSAGTGYGAPLSFTTLPSCTLPTVTTASITAILATSATGGGNVTATGGCAVTARGVCWSTSTNPTISNSHTSDGTGTGTFTSSITGLSRIADYEITYYIRAYATNSVGTAYGDTKTICYRPSNVSTALSFYGINYTIDGIYYPINSQSDAISVCSILHNKTSVSGSGLNVESVSFTVGSKLYSRSINNFDCGLSGFSGYTLNGYYPYNNLTIVYVVNGVIQSITPCP